MDRPATVRLVEQFAESVVSQTAAIGAADHRAGNRHAKRYIGAFRELCSIPGGRDALMSLFTHAQPDVRVMAAAFLLRHCPQDAAAVLHREARGTGLAALEAAHSLRRWEEGTWDLDPG